MSGRAPLGKLPRLVRLARRAKRRRIRFEQRQAVQRAVRFRRASSRG